jgi:hypothetical protein
MEVFGECATFFHQHAVKCYLVEPVDAAFLSDQEVTEANRRIQSEGYAMNH